MNLFDGLDASWQKFFNDDRCQHTFSTLEDFLSAELSDGQEVYPTKENIFSAFKLCPFNKTKVVIIGQDPYHGKGQAHGLSFSVPPNVRIPPSLKNIFKELENDIDFKLPKHGLLSSWARQGVLLLNQVLTVRAGEAGSHQGKGWESFTDRVISVLSDHKESLVFICWGAPAQKKIKHVDQSKHLVLKSPHPSPLSAYRGFFNQKHFSKANEFLRKNRIAEIDWSLPEIVQ